MNDNKKRINNEQELFELFCDPSDDRRYTDKPYKEKGKDFVFATNRASAVILNSSLYPNPNECEETEKPLFTKILSGNGEKKTIKLEALKKALNSLPQEKEFETIAKDETCEECNGKGLVEWRYRAKDWEEYFEMYECPCCQGEGVISHKRATGFTCPYWNTYIELGKRLFRSQEMIKLQHVMEYFGVKECVCYNATEFAMIFEIKEGVRVASCHIIPTELYEGEIAKVETE